ncbi:hypothetical protein J6590_079829 [Homalodisca vitripennis]|nr:hypothetical protein J6590_079829 [Homalodisca vitripennis]
MPPAHPAPAVCTSGSVHDHYCCPADGTALAVVLCRQHTPHLLYAPHPASAVCTSVSGRDHYCCPADGTALAVVLCRQHTPHLLYARLSQVVITTVVRRTVQL